MYRYPYHSRCCIQGEWTHVVVIVISTVITLLPRLLPPILLLRYEGTIIVGISICIMIVILSMRLLSLLIPLLRSITESFFGIRPAIAGSSDLLFHHYPRTDTIAQLFTHQ